jgi:hypothetical protein
MGSHTRIAAARLLATTFVTAGARAESTPSGIVQSSQHPAELSLAAGVALPFGKLQGDSKFRDEVRVAFPATFGVGARLFRSLSVGSELTWGWAAIGQNPWSPCSVGKCSTRLTRVGVAIAYHPLSAARWDPWLGLGVSYERLRFRATVPEIAATDPNSRPNPEGPNVRFTIRGWSLQSRVGVDYVLTPALRAGSFMSFDFGRYSEADVDEFRTTPRLPLIDVKFENQAFHYWIGGGVRLVFLGP